MTTTNANGYVARKNARHAAKWTLGEVAHHSREARKQHMDTRSYARMAAILAAPMPDQATERDAAAYLVGHRMLDEYADRLTAVRRKRLDLIHQRRQARATLASVRWTAADQRRADREEEEDFQRMEDRAWRDTHSRAYGDD